MQTYKVMWFVKKQIKLFFNVVGAELFVYEMTVMRSLNLFSFLKQFL